MAMRAPFNIHVRSSTAQHGRHRPCRRKKASIVAPNEPGDERHPHYSTPAAGWELEGVPGPAVTARAEGKSIRRPASKATPGTTPLFHTGGWMGIGRRQRIVRRDGDHRVKSHIQ